MGDFNNDGRLDLVVAGPFSSALRIFVDSGDGAFQAVQGNFAGSNAWSVAVGEFNSDGFPKLVPGNIPLLSVPRR